MGQRKVFSYIPTFIHNSFSEKLLIEIKQGWGFSKESSGVKLDISQYNI